MIFSCNYILHHKEYRYNAFPKEGLDPWPDQPMFDAMEKFQKDKGLQPR